MAINIRGLRAGFAALVVAMTVGLLASASAHAVTALETGHVDIVYTDINNAGTKLVLGTNDEDGGKYYEGATAVSELEFVVPKAAWGISKEGWATLLQDEEAAKKVPELEAGFAGSGDEDPNKNDGLRDHLTPGTHSIVLELTGLTTPAEGAIAIVRNGTTTWFDSVEDKQSFGITAGPDPEGFHLHSDWHFSKAGQYKLTFKATTNKKGVSASAPVTYTFDVK